MLPQEAIATAISVQEYWKIEQKLYKRKKSLRLFHLVK